MVVVQIHSNSLLPFWKKLLRYFGLFFIFFPLTIFFKSRSTGSVWSTSTGKGIPFYLYIYFYWHGLRWKESKYSQGSGADFLVPGQDRLEIWSGSNTKTVKQISLIFQVFPLEIITVSGHSLAPNKALCEDVKHLPSFRDIFKGSTWVF